MFKKLIDYIKERDELKKEIEALKEEKVALEKHNRGLHHQMHWYNDCIRDNKIEHEKELKNNDNKKVVNFISKVAKLIDEAGIGD
jgi:uncharacterized coiled-coil DUF342 family protein